MHMMQRMQRMAKNSPHKRKKAHPKKKKDHHRRHTIGRSPNAPPPEVSTIEEALCVLHDSTKSPVLEELYASMMKYTRSACPSVLVQE